MSDDCALIHRLMNACKRHHFPFQQAEIPLNGIYILFEKGEGDDHGHGHEHKHGQCRIVRVGTHTGDNRLRKRLEEHFLNERKDRSIFRKNIGRAILHRRKDSFLKYWEINLTSRQAREKYASLVDHEYQKSVERKVSRYIQNNFSFCVFEIADKTNRIELETKLISTISRCSECKPSKNWLGRHSPKDKIANSGLWQVNGLYKT